MSEIGYYRYKAQVSSDTDVNLYINSSLASTKSIEVIDFCGNMRLIRYLNKTGQYRFFAFNEFWESTDKPKELGRSNKIITSLLTGQSSENSVGYKNTRSLSLVANDISQAQLDILSDLWTSPKVFLYVGDGTTYDESDYIEVSLKSKNNLIRIKKGSYTDISVDVTLPEWYTINLL